MRNLIFGGIMVILISSCGQPGTVYKLNLPAGGSDSSKQNMLPKSALNILLLPGKKVYCYTGDSLKFGVTFSLENMKLIDKFISDKKTEITDTNFIIIIKPSDDATYQNTVDILDEMKINNIGRYALVDISKEETAFIKTLK